MLSVLTAKCRDSLRNYAGLVAQEVYISNCTKSDGTEKFRQDHYIKFYLTHHVEDPCLIKTPLNQQNYFWPAMLDH